MRQVPIRVALLSAILLTAGISHAQGINNNNKSTKNKEAKMAGTKKNEEVIRQLYERVLNKRGWEELKDLVSENYTGPKGIKGAEGFEKPITELIKAFPDVQWHVQELFGEGDKVAVSWKLQATHTGQYNNVAATGIAVTNDGMAIYELKGGKMINVEVLTDRLGFLQELGAIPQDLSTLSNRSAHKDKISLIDKFLVPPAAKAEFYERMHLNRSFIKTLPGFLGDEAYEYTDGDGNLICVTVAQWANKEAIGKAREAVQAEYKKEGFDMTAMIKRLNITIDRGLYTTVNNN